MKNNKIKSLNEYFSQTLTGDGFNSSNGVFKVDYKPFQDLSISVGRDPDPSLLVKDSAFQIGDLVKGNVQGKKKKITGEIIETFKSIDGKSYRIKIQGLKDKKIYALIPGSIEFTEDRGNTRNLTGLSISSREKMTGNLKYDGGNIVWGSLENEDPNDLLIPIENSEKIEGPFNTGWKIVFCEKLPGDNSIFQGVSCNVDSNEIYCLNSLNISDIKDIIKAAEAYCFMRYHKEMKDLENSVKSLLGVIFLELKNEANAKKILIQNFPHLTGESYGECRDRDLEKAKSIINTFIP
jgi:hypothetical protein